MRTFSNTTPKTMIKYAFGVIEEGMSRQDVDACGAGLQRGSVKLLSWKTDLEEIMSTSARLCRNDHNSGRDLGMINESNIASQKLLGLDVEIAESRSGGLVGVSGTIYYETKNMFYLYTPKGEKRIPKAGSVWEFAAKDSKIKVDGSAILKRPEERIA